MLASCPVCYESWWPQCPCLKPRDRNRSSAESSPSQARATPGSGRFAPMDQVMESSRCRIAWNSQVGSYWRLSGWWFGCHELYFPIYWECHHPNWLSYFSEGFKPPTSYVLYPRLAILINAKHHGLFLPGNPVFARTQITKPLSSLSISSVDSLDVFLPMTWDLANQHCCFKRNSFPQMSSGCSTLVGLWSLYYPKKWFITIHHNPLIGIDQAISTSLTTPSRKSAAVPCAFPNNIRVSRAWLVSNEVRRDDHRKTSTDCAREMTVDMEVSVSSWRGTPSYHPFLDGDFPLE